MRLLQSTEHIWRQLVSLSYKAGVEIARPTGPAARLIRDANTPQVRAYKPWALSAMQVMLS